LRALLDFTELQMFLFFKGCNVNAGSNYRITRGQINLAAGDVTLEALLQQRQQLQSGYNYFVSVGFSY